MVADNGRAGERLEMFLGPDIGIAPEDFRLFTSPRGADTIINFAQTDDHGDTVEDATVFDGKGVSSLSQSDGIAYGIIETPGDFDVFNLGDNRFESILVEVLGDSAAGGTLTQPLLTLFTVNADGTLNVVEFDVGTGPGGAARLIIPEYEGPLVDYYLIVASADQSETGTYTLRGILADDHADTLPDFDLLGSFDDRLELPVDREIPSELESPGDVDIVGVDAAAGATYTVAARGEPNRFGSKVDTYLEVYSDDGTLLGSADGGGDGTDAVLSFTAPFEDKFYFAISSGSTEPSDATGQYVIELTALDDYGDTPFDAFILPSDGTLIDGRVEHGTDEDHFGVRMVAGETYTIDIDPENGFDLALWSPNIGLLDVYDVDWWGLTTTYTATQTGMHYLSTATSFGVGTNSYELSVSGGGDELGATEDGDTLLGTDVAETIHGLQGDDAIDGFGGNDTVDAGAGNDLVDLGLGDDSVDGGAGTDTLSFASLEAPGININGIFFGAIVDLAPTRARAQTPARVTISSPISRTLRAPTSTTGSSATRTRTPSRAATAATSSPARAAMTRSSAGADFDVVDGGPGADVLYGGTTGGGAIETDIVAYFTATGPLDFVFGTSISELVAGTSPEIIDDVIGGDIEGVGGADGFSNMFDASNISTTTFFLGGRQSDVMYGGSGTDQLLGVAGDDVLYGNDGQDALIGEGGDDQFWTGGLDGAADFIFLDGINEGDDTIHDLELGVDVIFFTGGNVTSVRLEDTTAGGTAATDTLLTYQVNGVDAGTITIIDHDAAAVDAQAIISGL